MNSEKSLEANLIFSVVIPCYNAENEIKNCLDALLNSSYKNFEIVCVDDCSTDDTSRVINKYSRKVKLLRLKKNSGAAVARNEGVKAAKGDIIVLLDSDVIVKENTLENFKEDLIQQKGDVIIGNYSKKHPFKGFATNYKNFWLHYTYLILPKYLPFVNTPCLAMNKKVFKEIGGLDSDIKILAGEDWEFGQRIAMKGYKIFLDKSIEFVHMKNFTLKNILRTDARKSFGLVKMYLRTRNRKKSISCNNGYGSTPFHFIISAPLVSIILLLALLSLFFPVFLYVLFAFILLYFIINRVFFSLLFRTYGLLFTIVSSIIFYLNVFSVVIGGVAGLIDSLILGRRY